MTVPQCLALPKCRLKQWLPQFPTLRWIISCVAVFICLHILLSIIQPVEWGPSVAGSSARNDWEPPQPPGPFRRPVGSLHLQCDQFFADNQTYWQEYRKNRLTFEDPHELSMNCTDIRERHYFPRMPMSAEEADFPIAQMKIVYQDYILLEMELAAAYAPQNLYCYLVDAKSSDLFKSRVRQLTSCFPNVFIVNEWIHPQPNGFGMDRARLACMKRLLRRPEPWKYVLVTQNHEVTLKTNRETVQILKWLNGSNDIKLAVSRRLDRIKDYDKLNWTIEDVKIWRDVQDPQYRGSNKTKGAESVESPAAQPFFIGKGYAAMALRREFCEFVLRRLDVQTLLSRFDQPDYYGVDEFLFPSIHTNAQLGAPGGFASICTERNFSVPMITRYAHWSDECRSGQMRHWICIPGAEDLPTMIASLPHIFFNKFLPSFDFGASVCWYEHLYNRTYLGAASPPLPRELYTQLSHVRYQSLKDSNGRVSPEALAQFNCQLPPWPHLIQEPGK